IGFAALLLPRRPAVAGLCWGLLAFKPHLALLVPVVLLAAGAWRAFVAAAAGALALTALAWVVFGTATFEAFLATNDLARRALEDNLIGNDKMQSV
ncbi:glycosyltransferase 87 family protein, partial [Enterobacter hormaechei]